MNNLNFELRPTEVGTLQPAGTFCEEQHENGSFKPNFDFSKFDVVAAIRNEAENKEPEPENISEPESEENSGLLTVLPANTWMQRAREKKIPKMLFDEFWYEGELCILFADTNVGKSILAVQIADSISSGKPIPGFELEAQAQPVIYYDFELSIKQFENRYSIDYQNPYQFNDNFFRAEIHHGTDIPDKFNSFEDYLIASIEESIKQTKARVLIIDNITYLGKENEKAKDALPFMKHLNTLKGKYELSMLVLAHTPKRDASKPLTVNDVQGSKMFSNFCDSMFAIGTSQTDGKTRYIIQIKARHKEKKYESDNVCICQIAKPENFLQFDLLGYGKEWEHIREVSDDDRKEKIIEVKKLHQQGLTQRVVASRLGISVGAVNKYLKS